MAAPVQSPKPVHQKERRFKRAGTMKKAVHQGRGTAMTMKPVKSKRSGSRWAATRGREA
jgi:hypothetical protein